MSLRKLVCQKHMTQADRAAYRAWKAEQKAKTPMPTEPITRTDLRLPTVLAEKLKLSAKANNRSMNSEIVTAIEEWLKGDMMVRYELITQTNGHRTVRKLSGDNAAIAQSYMEAAQNLSDPGGYVELWKTDTLASPNTRETCLRRCSFQEGVRTDYKSGEWITWWEKRTDRFAATTTEI